MCKVSFNHGVSLFVWLLRRETVITWGSSSGKATEIKGEYSFQKQWLTIFTHILFKILELGIVKKRKTMEITKITFGGFG